MDIPWSGVTKKRNYNPEKDRLQYKDLAEFKTTNFKSVRQSQLLTYVLVTMCYGTKTIAF